MESIACVVTSRACSCRQVNALYCDIASAPNRRGVVVPGCTCDTVVQSWRRGLVALLLPVCWTADIFSDALDGSMTLASAVRAQPGIFGVVLRRDDEREDDDAGDAPAAAAPTAAAAAAAAAAPAAADGARPRRSRVAVTMDEYRYIFGLHAGNACPITLESTVSEVRAWAACNDSGVADVVAAAGVAFNETGAEDSGAVGAASDDIRLAAAAAPSPGSPDHRRGTGKRQLRQRKRQHHIERTHAVQYAAMRFNSPASPGEQATNAGSVGQPVQTGTVQLSPVRLRVLSEIATVDRENVSLDKVIAAPLSARSVVNVSRAVWQPSGAPVALWGVCADAVCRVLCHTASPQL